jgi:hypothetical protein
VSEKSGEAHARDQRLAELERWTTTILKAREDPDHRRILHGYAIWHHLRRLSGYDLMCRSGYDLTCRSASAWSVLHG